ncbi:MAG TPA: aminotransferase class I/II-fold pyridoxal phosphate-dependent enzyme [Candidatus Ratteibacteria bacterium]|jgi:alanine-synthesizing transaminase|uniref:Aminotransferase n=1 Tax=candidate division TA06 bacterium ADurb.Bin131 TaxID=1852827 RepID=A0A1V6C7R8_UNCT6|nr:MAG: Glutamate-pyruvate aminotransferase AlaC [candidate division TA06 bacterium ADurb.Bin131]HON06221.1 aminotransferase class I/II-fold pyridoxal phosphate-dependent enzyme [bacterium]HPC30012.1 aminotransferase class I/II-fold pyridoxal phosphate-dependent enzyme [bacterium]HRS06748.1 aminotransferase class I/II-fold pyridoxal phosphate-dependent enzyme [Candidatus Ratteibacteria bacterium]HRV04835.1 aminotransferase class I/II-fold pyridoxal phosphate-dependent enzyme [Candidatus Ratteib
MKPIESEKVRNLPAYLFQITNERRAKARQEGRDVIDLAMGNPDLPPPEPVIEKMREVLSNPKVHRYSASKGIPHLRREISLWYERRFNVKIDPEEEAIVTIGSKEGISHLALAIFDKGDVVLTPNPTYPSHFYSVIMSGASVYDVPLTPENNFVPDLNQPIYDRYPGPKAMIVSYPNNPTTQVVEIDFFKDLVKFAKKNNIIIIHDIAYSEICFDGYKAPSFLQVDGAKDVGVEFYSLSKTYNMAGWRVGFMVGNKDIVKALAKLKSYYDYGIFTPIQVAAICALRLDQKYIDETVNQYRKRRDTLVDGFNRIGWKVNKPKATMYVWAEIPEKFKHMGSLNFALYLLDECNLVVSPGVGFGKYGEGFVRIALVENEQRIKQAVRSLKKLFEK